MVYIVYLTPLIVSCMVSYFLEKYRKTKYRNTLHKITLQINKQARNLQISKNQKVIKDHYGSVFIGAWIKEINYFIRTRIDPIIFNNTKNEKSIDSLRLEARALIENVASIPLEISASPEKYISDPSIFDERMDPADYKQYCALLLRNHGWNAQATQKSDDQGTDVIAIKNGIRLVVQCKLYTKTVGNSAVQQAYTAKTFQGAQAAIVVTNSTFSKPARQAATTTGVYLIHHAQLVDTANEILEELI
ncbi:MAG: restriction endonuclease [Zymomonas mobilis]|uniref:Restriction system protein n=1 Tax=Zymomonas mobilis TaxID=542 RepID=A0A542W2L0_ZYMMB|nr:restriction endonuclease [Zymomonas mobilis]TQL17820.1 restriction system protein [Zymomonas mobilis]